MVSPAFSPAENDRKEPRHDVQITQMPNVHTDFPAQYLSSPTALDSGVCLAGRTRRGHLVQAMAQSRK
jgi:hypothetical protein